MRSMVERETPLLADRPTVESITDCP